MTCRGSRFNPELTTPGKNSPEWEAQNMRSTRNFIRKWGHFCKHDALMKPIIPPKYNIAFIVKNCGGNILEALEPWCDRIYIENQEIVDIYIDREQSNTKFDLTKRVFTLTNNTPEWENDIVVKFDATQLNNNNFQIISQLSEIIQESGEVGDFEIDIFSIIISHLEEYQNDLIKL
jgi:hypothetical protein